MLHFNITFNRAFCDFFSPTKHRGSAKKSRIARTTTSNYAANLTVFSYTYAYAFGIALNRLECEIPFLPTLSALHICCIAAEHCGMRLACFAEK